MFFLLFWQGIDYRSCDMGLRVKPARTGDAVVFWNMNPNATFDRVRPLNSPEFPAKQRKCTASGANGTGLCRSRPAARAARGLPGEEGDEVGYDSVDPGQELRQNRLTRRRASCPPRTALLPCLE